MTTVPALVTEVAAQYSPADARLIEHAYVFAAYWHRGQLRRSGDPYISHPLEVGAALAGLGLDAAMVCAGLLHDVIEDTSCPLDLLRTEFGEEITTLVEGLRTLSSLEAADPRVLLLKLADRLHNMRTIRFVPRARQEHKSRETLEVLVPLADQLGLPTLKAELEGLSLATLYPERFATRGGTSNAPKMSRRVLAVSAVLLPHRTRARWLEEWTAELHALPDRRSRARFTLQLLTGMTRLAVVLRQSPVDP